MTAGPPELDPRAALFLDFDGTLAPLQDNPDAVFLAAGQDEVLSKLAEDVFEGALAVVTGRDISDISRRVPVSLWRAGNHGLAIANPGESAVQLPPAPDNVREAANDAATLSPEIWIEEKGPVIAVHFRQCPELGPNVADVLDGALREQELYRVERGKGIVELKPKAANKGEAIRALMSRDPFSGRQPVFIGDDTTDEDGFRAVLDLGGLAVKVGDGPTAASHRLPSPQHVWSWLERGLDAIA